MDIVGVALIVALLACPLMMLLMHRGMTHRSNAKDDGSLTDLRRRRDALDATIRAREEDEPAADDQDRAPREPSTR